MTLEHLIADIVRRVVREEFASGGRAPTADGQLVTVAEFAAAKRLNVSTVRQAIRAGRLPSQRFGRAVRIPADATIAPATSTAPDDRAERRLGIVRGGGR